MHWPSPPGAFIIPPPQPPALAFPAPPLHLSICDGRVQRILGPGPRVLSIAQDDEKAQLISLSRARLSWAQDTSSSPPIYRRAAADTAHVLSTPTGMSAQPASVHRISPAVRAPASYPDHMILFCLLATTTIAVNQAGAHARLPPFSTKAQLKYPHCTTP